MPRGPVRSSRSMTICLPPQGTHSPTHQPAWPTAHTAHSQHCGSLAHFQNCATQVLPQMLLLYTYGVHVSDFGLHNCRSACDHVPRGPVRSSRGLGLTRRVGAARWLRLLVCARVQREAGRVGLGRRRLHSLTFRIARLKSSLRCSSSSSPMLT